MNVELISWPWMDEEALCGLAAAECTGAKDHGKALEAALRSGHMSVLEHAAFTFLVEGVSRALLAQITRHRLASFSVRSQRYIDMADMEVAVPESIRADPDLMDEYADLAEDIRGFYRRAIAAGIPKEDARYITPQAALTGFVVTMNARELRHFFKVRCCNRAQWEIRARADEMLRLVKKEAPALFDGAGPGCVSGECTEARPCGHARKEGEWEWQRT